MDLVRTRWNFSGVEVDDVAQGVCMTILRTGTPLGAWPSNLLIWVCSATDPTRCNVSHSFHHLEMLTPIDQPLDKLEDLRPNEMYVCSPDVYTCSNSCSSAKT